MSQPIPSAAPLREFKDHEDAVTAVAAFPDGQRIVTGSTDKTLRLWDLKTGVVLKKMERHRSTVWRLAVSPDGQFIASGDQSGEVIVWHGETGEPLTQLINAHSSYIFTLDFSPGGTMLASGSADKTTKLWNTKTWKPQGNPIKCSSGQVFCIRHSPSGELLAIATSRTIEIYNTCTRECVANLEAVVSPAYNLSLAWTPNGTRLLTGGSDNDPTIREWDTSTWQQIGDPWTGHTSHINGIAIHPASTLVASASTDNHVRLWRLSDRRTIAIFQPSLYSALCVTFSVDGKYILSGGRDMMVSQWAVPKLAQVSDSKILAINTTVRNACITGDLSAAEQLLVQDINSDANNHTSYADRSLVMARKHLWDDALRDANKSVEIQPSLTGYISTGIALCGKKLVRDARTAFDIAFIFANEDSKITHFIFLIKAIAIFNADQHEEAINRVRELAAARPNDDALACRIVEAYMYVRLGINAMDSAAEVRFSPVLWHACHNEAADYFIAAVNSTVFSSASAIHSMYEDFVVLFGWDLKSLWRDARQKLCDALLRAGRLEEAQTCYRDMMDQSDKNTKACCLDWSNNFKQECTSLCAANGDAALAARDYDRAINLYSAAIDLNPVSNTVFANRSKAKLEKMLWEDALLDVQKVIELNPVSHVGYQVKHAALYGAKCYNESIEAFEMMLSKLNNAPDMRIRKLRQQYDSPSEVAGVIRKVIDAQLDTAPLRLVNIATGLLCDREEQTNPPTERIIAEVVAKYFRYAMLSHRWEGKELLLEDIQDKVVYELGPIDGSMKLQSFCKTARDAGYHWAWSDTCCIKKNDPAELEISIKSMFDWYHHSALTIVYLSDVLPSSKSGALANSAWNTRGWTVQEFLAPKVILFYWKDWTLYLGDCTPNHKESDAIMRELESATGIDRRVVKAFRPGMPGAREKLQWASRRVTKLEEDIAYSLSGIFNVRLSVDYGERKQNALGRLLQEIIARSGDLTALDWVGQSSTFNSCLPADIISYATPPRKLQSLSGDKIQSSVSSLRGAVTLESASRLYQTLDLLSAPHFVHRRLRLPCIVFPVTEAMILVTKAKVEAWSKPGTHIPMTSRQMGFVTCGLPRKSSFPSSHRKGHRPPGRHCCLEWRIRPCPNLRCTISSPAENAPVYSESHSRALRLMVRLEEPFAAFLLARQPSGEFKRIASDHDIIAQVKDMASVHGMMEIKTIEIS
ncbi:hypothetical protein DFH29DRAFT_404756 [Suillus ampliporus]|nr:hypothetical protein DFH29DRAFT_404756 [Suillus ampliporus]